jgi:4-azaleucine resistance transporter AzlC
MRRRAAAIGGARDAAPIAVAYLAVGATFGVVARAAGWSPWLAVACSGAIYAGASQFLLVGLSAAGASPGAALAAVLLANLRHVVYSSTLRPRLARYPVAVRLVAAFGLTDEVFALTAARPGALPGPARQLSLEASAFAAWLGGSALGAFAGAALPGSWSRPVAYALPALFVALIVGQARGASRVVAAIAGGGAAVAAAAGGGALGHADILVGAVVGAAAGALWAGRSAPRGAGANAAGRPEAGA